MLDASDGAAVGLMQPMGCLDHPHDEPMSTSCRSGYSPGGIGEGSPLGTGTGTGTGTGRRRARSESIGSEADLVLLGGGAEGIDQ